MANEDVGDAVAALNAAEGDEAVGSARAALADALAEKLKTAVGSKMALTGDSLVMMLRAAGLKGDVQGHADALAPMVNQRAGRA